MGNINVKVLRIDPEAVTSRKSRLRRKFISEGGVSNKSTPDIIQETPISSSKGRVSTGSSSSLGTATTTTSSIRPIPSPNDKKLQQMDNLVDTDNDLIETSNFHNAPSNNPPEVDLWAFSNDTTTKDTPSTSFFQSDIDFSSPSPPTINTTPVASREELVERREAKIAEKVKEALEFKQEIKLIVILYQLFANYTICDTSTADSYWRLLFPDFYYESVILLKKIENRNALTAFIASIYNCCCNNKNEAYHIRLTKFLESKILYT
jgi:hypothetical protein